MTPHKNKLGYVCDCGVFNEAGVWGAAHWNEVLVHTCACGRQNTIKRGTVLSTIHPMKAKQRTEAQP